jgi:hypothetical protein
MHIAHLNYLNNCLAINEFYGFKSGFPIYPPFYWFNLLLKKMFNRRTQRSVQILYNVVCPTTGPSPLPKRILNTVRSSAPSFIVQYLPVKVIQ